MGYVQASRTHDRSIRTSCFANARCAAGNCRRRSSPSCGIHAIHAGELCRQSKHRVSRICPRRRTGKIVSKLFGSGDAVFVIDRMQWSSPSRVRLRRPHCLFGPCGLPPDGPRRRIGHGVLSARQCHRACRLPGSLGHEFGQATRDGRAKLCRGVADDNAQCHTKVSSPFRSSAARPNVALCIACPALAAMGSLEVPATEVHDKELVELGQTLSGLTQLMGEPCRCEFNSR